MQFNHKRKNGIALANHYRSNFELAKKQLLHHNPKRIRLTTDYHPHLKINTNKLKEQLQNVSPHHFLQPHHKKKLDPYDFTLMRSFSTQYMYKPNPAIQGNYSSVLKPNKFLDLRGQYFNGSEIRLHKRFSTNLKVSKQRIEKYEIKQNTRGCCERKKKSYSGQGMLRLRINEQE